MKSAVIDVEALWYLVCSALCYDVHIQIQAIVNPLHKVQCSPQHTLVWGKITNHKSHVAYACYSHFLQWFKTTLTALLHAYVLTMCVRSVFLITLSLLSGFQ